MSCRRIRPISSFYAFTRHSRKFNVLHHLPAEFVVSSGFPLMFEMFLVGGPSGIRTHYPLLRRQVLCPDEL